MPQEEILKKAEDHMQKALEVLRKELASLRAGRANPALLEKVQVNYYGVPTPINQVANISAPEARLLIVQPWDKNMVGEVEKAILKSDLGLNPSNDGIVIRIGIPMLTEERRKELVKAARKRAEESRVAIRNVRREGNDELKLLEKNGEMPKDIARRAQEEMQKLTDKNIASVDRILSGKEIEIMEV
jgi:ribosome recycling factor